MRVLSHIGLAYVLLVLTGALWGLLPVAPDLAVVFAVYLGITARSPIEGALAGIIVIGWIADLLTGAPRGISSVSLGVVCILCRMISARLLLRGRLFVAVFAMVFSLIAAILAVVIRAWGGAPLAPFWREVVNALGTAALTGLFAPVVFRLCRLVDARFARTQREREAISEGYVS